MFFVNRGLVAKKMLGPGVVAALGLSLLGLPASETSVAAPKKKMKISSIPAGGNATSGVFTTELPGPKSNSRKPLAQRYWVTGTATECLHPGVIPTGPFGSQTVPLTHHGGKR